MLTPSPRSCLRAALAMLGVRASPGDRSPRGECTLTIKSKPDALVAPADLETWVHQAQHGDTAAADRVLSHFTPLLRNTARKYVGVSGEDAFQEASLALWNCICGFDGGRGVPFVAYAAAKVRGDVRTAMRRLWTHDGRMAYAAPAGAASAAAGEELWDVAGGGFGHSAEETGYSETEWDLCLAQAGLSPRERTAMHSLMEGTPCSALARQYGVSEETAKTWRKRGVRKLRAIQ